MKRSEIHVGDELYYDKYRDWATAGYGRRVVVKDVGRYTTKNIGFHGDKGYRADPNGICVLVEIDSGATFTDRREVIAVPTAHLRGAYETTRSEVEKLRAAAAAEREAKSQRAVTAWSKVRDLEERARNAGIQVQGRLGASGLPEFTLDLGDLSKLLDAYTA